MLRLVAFAALAAFATAHWGMLVEDARPAASCSWCSLPPAAPRPWRWSDAPRCHAPIHALAALIALVTLVLGLRPRGCRPGCSSRRTEPSHRRARPRSRGRGGRGLAIRRRRLDPADGPARLPGAPHDRRDARVLAGPAGHGSAARGRADHAAAAVRQRGGRARSRQPASGGWSCSSSWAWLRLPRLPRREALLAAAVTVGVGAVDSRGRRARRQPSWWDYHAWNWFGGGKVITFDWTHSYGPLDWSRAGATVLNVKSDRPHYWKAETLDEFDGLRWCAPPTSTTRATAPGRDRAARRGALGLQRVQRGWDERHPLHGALAVHAVRGRRGCGPGRRRRPRGWPRRHHAADRREQARGGRRLSAERVRPEPDQGADGGSPDGLPAKTWCATPIQLRNRARRRSRTRRGQPSPARAGAPARAVRAAAGNGPSDWGPRSERLIRDSPYAAMYDQARELTDGQPTAYDAVKSVETGSRTTSGTRSACPRIPTR